LTVPDRRGRQFSVFDPQVEPDGRTEVTVHQVIHDLVGTVQADVEVFHVYMLRDGLVSGWTCAKADRCTIAPC
jgi:hypothetical protein